MRFNSRRHLAGFSGLALLLLAGGCRKDAAPHGAPAQVSNPRAESDLATVRLTPLAEQRLGIVTALVELRDMARTRTTGGEVTVQPGRSLVVSAPLAGTLMAPSSSVPAAGTIVEVGQPVFRLLVLPGDGSVANLREAIAVAQAQVQLARMRAARARELRAANLASEEELEIALANAVSAEATLAATRARLQLVEGSAPPESVALALPPLQIASPVRGVIRRIHAAEGQRVAAASPLFDVENLEQMWVRVPVYVGDLRDIDNTASVSVTDDAQARGRAAMTARPVKAPPSADPVAASADLFYELTSAPTSLRPGQRVTVQLPLKGRERRLVVPTAAVVYDVQGGAWIYEQTAPHTFVRRRVEVAFVSGNLAVLSRGPAAGTRAVTDGAAELFGTEFGGGK